MKAGACTSNLDLGVEAILQHGNKLKGAVASEEWRRDTPMLHCLPLDIFHMKQANFYFTKIMVYVTSLTILTVRMLLRRESICRFYPILRGDLDPPKIQRNRGKMN